MGKNSKARAEMTMHAWAAVSAIGEDLDTIGKKYKLARHPLETDQAFRCRVQAEIQYQYHNLVDDVTVTMTATPDRTCGKCKNAVFGATGNYCKIDKSPIKSDGKCHNSEFEVYVKKIVCDGKSFDCNPDESPCTKCDPKDRNCAAKDRDTDCDAGGWWDPSNGIQLSQLEFLIGEIEHRYPPGIRGAAGTGLLVHLDFCKRRLVDPEYMNAYSYVGGRSLFTNWNTPTGVSIMCHDFPNEAAVRFAMRILNEAFDEYENYKNTVVHPPQTSPTMCVHSGSGDLTFGKTDEWLAMSHDQCGLEINGEKCRLDFTHNNTVEETKNAIEAELQRIFSEPGWIGRIEEPQDTDVEIEVIHGGEENAELIKSCGNASDFEKAILSAVAESVGLSFEELTETPVPRLWSASSAMVYKK